MKVIIAILLFLCSISMSAQGVPVNPFTPDFNVIPPSPTVQGMMKFEEVPVDLFRGLPDVTVPIFTVRSGNLSFPISLKYHGGGHKVDREKGVVGYSWGLSATACVARTVYGLPDYLFTGNGQNDMCGLKKLQAGDKELRNHIMSRTDGGEYTPYNVGYFKDNHETIIKRGRRYYFGECDMASDLYHLTGAGLSGVFGYDDNGNIILSSPSPIVIAEQSGLEEPFEFNISSSDGRIFKFADKELTKGEWLYGDPKLYNGEETYKVNMDFVSAWYLSEMTNLNGDKIKFHYIKSAPVARQHYSEKQVKTGVPGLENYIQEHVRKNSSVLYNQLLIDRIESKFAIVRFKYGKIPSTSYVSSTLQSIEVFAPNDTTVPIKTISLKYNNGELQQVTENGEILRKFDYYDINFDNKGIDFGGYYNNTPGGTRLPEVNIKGYEGGTANRSVNPNVAEAGNLKTIKYPTGAEVTFNWKANVASNITQSSETGESISQIVNTKKYHLRYCSNDNSCCVLRIDNIPIHSNNKVKLDLSHYFCFDISYLNDSEYQRDHSDENPNYPRVVFSWIEANGKLNKKTYYLDHKTIYETFSNKPKYIDLPDGIYSIQLLDPINIGNLPSNVGLADYFDESKGWNSGHIYIEVETTTSPTNGDGTPVTYWPGARIQSISYNPNDGTEPINKDYYYYEYNSEAGLAQHEPTFNYSYYGYANNPDTGLGDVAFVANVLIDNGLPNSPLGGNEVEYPQVRTRFTRGVHKPDDVNGYYTYHTESYYYTSFNDKRNYDLCETPMVDFQPPSSRMYTSNAHRRGLLYKKISGFQSPMITTEYHYTLHEDSNTPYLTTDLFAVCDFIHTAISGVSDHYARDYHIGKYRIIPYSRTIDKEVTIEHISSMREKRDSIEYTYYEPVDSYTGFMQPQRLKRSMTRWDSSGNKITTYYTYRGFSYKLTNNFEAKLWVSVPETEITTVGDENPRVVKALRRRFIRRTDRVEAVLSTSNLSNITIRHNTPKTPTEYQNLINEPKYSYQYDKDGNIVQISYKNMAVCSYLWAHQGCYPVLEAKNISYDTLLAALTHANISQDEMSKLETLSAAKWLDVRNSIAQLAPQAEVTQLTYSPLIGILSATDAAGLTTTYNYDTRGRLIDIKDFNGFLIEKYEYHFKGF